MMNRATLRTAIRAGAAVGLAATAAVAGQSAALADAPTQGSFSITESFTDSEVCAAEGLDVEVTQTESATFDIFHNSDGSTDRALLHWTYVAAISANGHLINESDRWQQFSYSDGSSREAGSTVHISGPGGLVQHDAGQIDFNPDGTVAVIRGPHPQFEGQSFCFALVP